MNIKTERLAIKEFSRDMAMAVHKNSLDEDTRRFLPDEVLPDEVLPSALLADEPCPDFFPADDFLALGDWIPYRQGLHLQRIRNRSRKSVFTCHHERSEYKKDQRNMCKREYRIMQSA